MPNIEATCGSGLLFDNAYAAPARAAIMNGIYELRTGVGAPVDPNGSDHLSIEKPTLFDALTPAGCASNVIGKWHVSGRNRGSDAPAYMGASDHFGLYACCIRDYFNWTAIKAGQSDQAIHRPTWRKNAESPPKWRAEKSFNISDLFGYGGRI